MIEDFWRVKDMIEKTDVVSEILQVITEDYQTAAQISDQLRSRFNRDLRSPKVLYEILRHCDIKRRIGFGYRLSTAQSEPVPSLDKAVLEAIKTPDQWGKYAAIAKQFGVSRQMVSQRKLALQTKKRT